MLFCSNYFSLDKELKIIRKIFLIFIKKNNVNRFYKKLENSLNGEKLI